MAGRPLVGLAHVEEQGVAGELLNRDSRNVKWLHQSSLPQRAHVGLAAPAVALVPIMCRSAGQRRPICT